jgi:hypothetical protein
MEDKVENGLVSYPVEDLTQKSNEEILRLLRNAQEGNIVFHGSNASEPFSRIEARQAHDHAKESGNKKAVYASVGLEEALFKTVFSRSYLSDQLHSYTIGWDFKDGNFAFKADPQSYDILSKNYEECFSDGYLYILDRSKFQNAPDSKYEYHSEEDQIPQIAYKIPGLRLAKELFPMSSFKQYSPEEMKKIHEKIKSRSNKD